MKILLLLSVLTWASASILPSNNNMIYFEFDKPAQTPEDLQRQSKLIEMIMPELSKVLPQMMQTPKISPMQQRPVEYYYMEPMKQVKEPITKMFPQKPKKPLKQRQEEIMMQSIPMVLQMIAEEHSIPHEMSLPTLPAPVPSPPPPPPPMMMHTPTPPKPFLEPPHFYMKHQFDEPQRHQMPFMTPMHHPYQPYFIEPFMGPPSPPMYRQYPIYDFHPPMIQNPYMFYHQMNMRQPMMGPEYYYW